MPLTGAARAELNVWMRPVENRPIDLLAATMLADAAPPALFAHVREPVQKPSLEIAVHYAQLTALGDSPWLLGEFGTR